MRITRMLAAALALIATLPGRLHAQVGHHPRETGLSAIWLLANVSFAGMRAQNHPSARWRMVAFLFGLPGTLVTFFVVTEGSERAYGVDLPRTPWNRTP